ncbi:glycine-rich protein 3-like [Centruroides sculpturatus]|uniref:glycine-rich protein 3-like n=1 Tax=Centruroides sculpturatus TaxID=218467 RepID=UPI000C6EC4D5|nr:glycine-rich protein 3-like [Centruroides sculpturatus]
MKAVVLLLVAVIASVSAGYLGLGDGLGYGLGGYGLGGYGLGYGGHGLGYGYAYKPVVSYSVYSKPLLGLGHGVLGGGYGGFYGGHGLYGGW